MPIYIEVRLRGFHFLQFRKALYLLKIPFSCISVNFSLKGIIRDPFTTFNFLLSFYKTRLYRLFTLFVTLFTGYSRVRKFLLLSKVAKIVHWWGSDDDAVGWVWGVPKFRDIPLGPTKVPSSGFLGFVTSGLLNL